MEGNHITYRQLREQYVSNLNGTTNTETFLAVTPNYLSVLFVCIQAIKVEKDINKINFLNFSIEFIVIFGTGILLCTIASNHLPHLIVTLAILCCSSYVFKIRQINIMGSREEFLTFSVPTVHKCYVTNFRALVYMLSCVSILAVDFTVFPRRFAKTETFGYSPMDVGVGLFCISNSIIVPYTTLHKISDNDSSFIHSLFKTLKSCLPLIVLGGVRFFTTKQVDYFVHVSEYGVHWNFFLTLTVSKLISFFILRVFNIRHALFVSFAVIIIYETILLKGLQDWIFSDFPRDNFLTANREGIASSIGYVALFIAGIGIGNLIYCESNKIFDLIQLIKKFTLLSVLMWTVTLSTQNYFFASRRLANFGYFVWIITFTVTTLTFFMLVDFTLLALKYFTASKTPESVTMDPVDQVPILFSAMNYNGLAFFLIANLLTGLVNLSIETFRVDELYSLMIIFIYSYIACVIIYILYCKNIKLKIW